MARRAGHGQRLALPLLIAALLIGGGARVWQAAHPYTGHRSFDEYAYQRLALRLSAEHRYDDWDELLTRAPLTAGVFAVADRIAPSASSPDDRRADLDVPAAYWAQALLSVLLLPCLFLIGRAAGAPLAGAVAALLVAVYAPAVQGVGEALSETTGALSIAGAVLAVLWATGPAGGRLPERARYAIAGGAAALATLARAELLVAALVLAALVLLWHGRRAALPFAAAFVVVLAPWTAFASHRAGHLVPVTTGDAMPLFMGTYLPGEGDRRRTARAFGVADLGGVERALAARHPGLAVDAAVRREAYANLRRDVVHHPLRFAGQALARQRLLWLTPSNPGQPARRAWKRVQHVLYVLAAVALLGVGWWRGRARRATLVVLAPVLAVAAVHVLLFATPRYNLPVLPLLVLAGLVAVSAPAAGTIRASS